MSRRLAAFVALALFGVLLTAVPLRAAPPAAPTLPADFADQLVTNVGKPTALAFTPDGRVLVTTMTGQLRVVTAAGSLLPTPALDVAPITCSIHERGMLGVAVDPAFATNHFVFVFYTMKNGSDCGQNGDPYPFNRMSRFTLPASNVIDPASEVVVLDHIPSRNGHNAGDVHFGADGLIYVSVGDGVCRLDPAEQTLCNVDNNNARNPSLLLGKILRVAPDGSIPATNPNVGRVDSHRCGDPAGTAVSTGPGPCLETFASGLRNPFRFAVRPGTSDLYINDVGEATWDEIDFGAAGADYGWNVREGHCAVGSASDCGDPPAGMTNPIFDYAHTAGCSSITGGAFVPAGLWPAPLDGAYLFADYICGKVFSLDAQPGGGFAMADFVTGLGASSATSLAFGPSPAGQSLYYTTFAGGGEVRRISFTGQLSTTTSTTTTTVPGSTTDPTSSPTTTTTAPVPLPPGPQHRSGYWMVGTDGTVYPFGDAKAYGNAPTDSVADLEPTPSGNGYWIVDEQGGVFAFGDAAGYGNADRSQLAPGEKITSVSAIPSGAGYWLFTTRGRVLPFGDAPFLGDVSRLRLAGPVLDSIPTPSGRGYYMVASDGGIFAFGDANFEGSMGGRKLNAAVQSLVPDSDGRGYWLVAGDGGIFAFDADFHGSMGAVKLNRPITGMVRAGHGYLMVGEDGGIFDFSGTPDGFKGSLGSRPPGRPITSVAVLEER
jgi:glucose/arabinose dehydrogenase